MSLCIIILAAGQGARMHSDRPKVLHSLAGKPLLAHVFQTALSIDHREIFVVYGSGGEQVPEAMQGYHVSWVKQEEQLGTGHAVPIRVRGRSHVALCRNVRLDWRSLQRPAVLLDPSRRETQGLRYRDGRPSCRYDGCA